MTRKERETVEWAVRELMKDDGDFNAAVGRLARMVGLTTAQDVIEGAKIVRVDDFRSLPVGPFRYPGDDRYLERESIAWEHDGPTLPARSNG